MIHKDRIRLNFHTDENIFLNHSTETFDFEIVTEFIFDLFIFSLLKKERKNYVNLIKKPYFVEPYFSGLWILSQKFVPQKFVPPIAWWKF